MQHNVPLSVCYPFTVLSVSNKGLGLSQQAMHRQEHFRECSYTPCACCGISFLPTTVNTLHFSNSQEKVQEHFSSNSGKIAVNRILYNVFCQIISSRRFDMNGIRGYLSIRKASCRCGGRCGGSTSTASPDVFPVHPGSGAHVRSRRMQKSRLIRIRRMQIE